MAELDLGRFAKTLEQPAYIAVGFGVLGFQRARVCQRAWQRRLVEGARRLRDDLARDAGPVPRASRRPLQRVVPGARPGTGKPLLRSLSDVVGGATDRLGPLVSEATDRLGPLVSEATDRLPPEAKELLTAAGDVVVDLSGEAREVAKEAAAFGRFAIEVLRAPVRRSASP
ncbi:MAG: hypothetical protein ACRDZX_06320 [Acidimicrobiales bacterium]